jgi:small neutral amino acid transporter SnatA (MarC family)
MTGWVAVLVAFFAAVNPAAVGLAAPAPAGNPWRAAVVPFATAAAILVAAVAGADRLLDSLGIEPESFRTAAGLVMAVAGGRMVWDPAPVAAGRSWLGGAVPTGWPWIANPATIVVALSFGADAGVTKAAVAGLLAAAAGALAAALPGRSRTVLDAAARLTGAGLVVMAAGLVVSGIRSI